MKNYSKPLRLAGIIFGLLTIAFFMLDAIIVLKLQPRMIRFDAISPAEDNLFNWVGIGLLVFAAFYSLSLLKNTVVLKNADKITFFSLLLVLSGVVSLLFVFADFSLFGDIHKQYLHGFEQPEWLVLLFTMGFQFLTALVFTYLHLFGFSKGNHVMKISQDSNIFLVIQFVGIICGLMGAILTGLGFIFTGAMMKERSLMNLITLLPYALGVGFWLWSKIKQENREWFDEKQFQDISRSALVTLALEAVLMTVLFSTNFSHLDGVISLIWFPLYIFSSLLFFSLGNLVRTIKV